MSDVFHNGQPESALWQFKHGNGNFKRGDLNGLREIKRRASRHTLIHRDSFSGPTPHKPSVSQPGTPAEPMLDPVEARMAHIEHNMFEMHARLVRTEESNTALSAKCQALNESLVKAHQWHIETTHMIAALLPDQDHPVRRDGGFCPVSKYTHCANLIAATGLEREVIRQLDMIRNYEDPHESLLSGRQPYFSNMALGEPVSPRQANNEERRPSLHAVPPRPTMYRPPVPQQPHHNMPMPQRRYGSIGTANPLPNYHRPLQPHSHLPAPAGQHPLANVQEPPSSNGPNMGRRHTSADIRVPNWPGQNPGAGGPGPGPAPGTGSPLASGQSSGHWPSSPMQATLPAPSLVPPTGPDDQSVRDQLNAYSFGTPRQSLSNASSSHHTNTTTNTTTTTPPLTSNDTTPSTLSADGMGWSGFGGGAGSSSNTNHINNSNSKFPGTARHLDFSSAPQTRRSSMASNVHSLLNPAETAERDEEDPLGGREEERRGMDERGKRKRLV